MGAVKDDVLVPDRDPLEAPWPAGGCQSSADRRLRQVNAGRVHDVQCRQSGARVLDLMWSSYSSVRCDSVPQGPLASNERQVPFHDQSLPAIWSGEPISAAASAIVFAAAGTCGLDTAGTPCLRIPAFCQAMSAWVGPSTAVCSKSMRVMTETIESMTLVAS